MKERSAQIIASYERPGSKAPVLSLNRMEDGTLSLLLQGYSGDGYSRDLTRAEAKSLAAELQFWA